MARDPKHRDQVNRARKARYLAIERLIKAHQKEFDAIYEEEAAKAGVTPHSVMRKRKAQKLREQLAQLEEEK